MGYFVLGFFVCLFLGFGGKNLKADSSVPAGREIMATGINAKVTHGGW